MVEASKQNKAGMSKKNKYVILTLMLIIGLYIFISVVEQEKAVSNEQTVRLQKSVQMYEPKTLTISPNTIQITSIHTDYPVCTNNAYLYASDEFQLEGVVDFNGFLKITGFINNEGYASFSPINLDISNFTGSLYQVQINNLNIDTPPAIGKLDSVSSPFMTSITNGRDKNNKFYFDLSGISPTESHAVHATFMLVSLENNIRSNPIDVTYMMPKSC